jgi:hypothetical protein
LATASGNSAATFAAGTVMLGVCAVTLVVFRGIEASMRRR